MEGLNKKTTESETMRVYLVARSRRQAWEEEFKQQKLQEMLELVMGLDLPTIELKAALGHLGLKMADLPTLPLAEAAQTEYNDN